jgi:transcriptional regulator with XRE-family HTH domain
VIGRPRICTQRDERMATLRDREKLSHKQIAARLGVTHQVVSKALNRRKKRIERAAGTAQVRQAA